MYTLIKYDKFQQSPTKLNGIIVMENKENANGFFEKIIEIGFEKYFFEIQYTLDGILYGLNIGSLDKVELEIENNKKIVQHLKNILPLLELLKK